MPSGGMVGSCNGLSFPGREGHGGRKLGESAAHAAGSWPSIQASYNVPKACFQPEVTPPTARPCLAQTACRWRVPAPSMGQGDL